MSFFQQRIEGYPCHCLLFSAFYAKMASPFVASSHLAGYSTKFLVADMHSEERPLHNSAIGWLHRPLHSSLPFIQSPLWNKCNATVHRQWQFSSSLELLNCLWGFPSNLYFLWCKIEYKSLFCQFEESWAAQFLSYFAIVTKTHREKYIKSHFCSLLLYCHLVHNSVNLHSADIFLHTKIHFVCLRQWEYQSRSSLFPHIVSYKVTGIHWSE